MAMPETRTGSQNGGTWEMFDRIARRYDVLNHTLSLARDFRWRRAVADRVAAGPCRRYLDLACGTGDLLFEAAGRRPGPSVAVGLDRSGRMLAAAQAKAARNRRGDGVCLVHGDGMRTCFPDGSFDAVTIAFGIRNLPSLTTALAEIRRLLRPGGRVYILEFSRPETPVVRWLYGLYVRHFVPLAGGLVSGDRTAYSYLQESIAGFPSGAAFCELVRGAGFAEVRAHAYTFGIATLYEAVAAGAAVAPLRLEGTHTQ